MSTTSAKRSSVLLSLVAIGAAFCFGLAQARAGDDNVTEDQIVRALAPPKKPLTRGLSMGPQTDPVATEAEGKFVQSIRGRATRSLSTAEREEIATIAKDKPNIDLEITFDYNSADISSKSLGAVQALGRALTNPDLKGRAGPPSPCTNVCRLDGQGFCAGCLRTGTEIGRWMAMSAAEQWQLIEELNARRARRDGRTE